MELYIFICHGTCEHTLKIISSLNKMIPSGSLFTDEDFLWQMMSGVYLIAKLMQMHRRPAHLSCSEEKFPFHFRWFALRKDSSCKEKEAGWLSSQRAKSWFFHVTANKVVGKPASGASLLVKMYPGCIHVSCTGETKQTLELLHWFLSWDLETNQ